MPLNLNRHSGLSPGNANWQRRNTAATSVTELLNAQIDAALEAERAAQPERDYIGMSELGDECLRRVFYRAEKAEAKPLEGKKVRIFHAGNLYEDLVYTWLISAGYKIDCQQDEILTAYGQIQGHIDGRITDGPGLPGLMYYALWENKGLGSKWWKQCVKKGLRLYEPKYYGQTQLYLGYKNWETALFTAINKDTCEIYAEVIPFELSEAQKFSDRGVTLINHLRDGNPPRRLCPNPDFFESRFCDFADFCWKDERNG